MGFNLGAAIGGFANKQAELFDEAREDNRENMRYLRNHYMEEVLPMYHKNKAAQKQLKTTHASLVLEGVHPDFATRELSAGRTMTEILQDWGQMEAQEGGALRGETGLGDMPLEAPESAVESNEPVSGTTPPKGVELPRPASPTEGFFLGKGQRSFYGRMSFGEMSKTVSRQVAELAGVEPELVDTWMEEAYTPPTNVLPGDSGQQFNRIVPLTEKQVAILDVLSGNLAEGDNLKRFGEVLGVPVEGIDPGLSREESAEEDLRRRKELATHEAALEAAGAGGSGVKEPQARLRGNDAGKATAAALGAGLEGDVIIWPSGEDTYAMEKGVAQARVWGTTIAQRTNTIHDNTIVPLAVAHTYLQRFAQGGMPSHFATDKPSLFRFLTDNGWVNPDTGEVLNPNGAKEAGDAFVRTLGGDIVPTESAAPEAPAEEVPEDSAAVISEDEVKALYPAIKRAIEESGGGTLTWDEGALAGRQFKLEDGEVVEVTGR